MSREGKLTILQALLVRVKERAGAPRSLAVPTSAETHADLREVAKAPAVVAEPAPHAPPASEEVERVPPSAPRVRDGAAVDPRREPEETADEPKPWPTPDEAQEDDDQEIEMGEMDIAITVSDTPPPPDGDVPLVQIPPSPPPSGIAASGVRGSDALEEPAVKTTFDEFERPTAAAETLEALPDSARGSPPGAMAPPPVASAESADISAPPHSHQELSWPPPAPGESAGTDVPPATIRREAWPAAAPAPEPVEVAAVAPAPVVALPAAEPPALGIRLLVEPGPGGTPSSIDVPALAEGQAHTEASLAVSAGSQVTAVLRGAAGTFVEQNRTFAPPSFGELLDASLELGR